MHKGAAYWGWANRAVPASELASTVEWFGRRLALIDPQMLQYSKRSVNRAHEFMGIRTALNAGAGIQAFSAVRPQGGTFGDFRTKGNASPRKEYPDVESRGRPGSRRDERCLLDQTLALGFYPSPLPLSLKGRGKSNG
ncbi:MAG: hypothetical protein ACR2PL_24445 [Dehalococcoidia bacterium]